MGRRSVLAFKRQVWRITPDAPQGRWVDPQAECGEQAQSEERPEPGWRQSSFDLAFGLDVHDDTDTVPAELLDELFKKPTR